MFKIYKELKKDLLLQPMTIGKPIRLNNVFFVVSKPVLLSGSHEELDNLAAILLENTELKIQIDGHTDNQGSAEKNLELSEQRAETVKNYLVDHGIDAKRLKTAGFGGSKPVNQNLNETERRANRRVEFTILTK